MQSRLFHPWMSQLQWMVTTDEMPVKIQKDLKREFQKIQTAKTKPVKFRRMLNKRHLWSKRANMFKTRRQWTSSIWDRKKPWCRGQKRSEQRGVVSERKDEDDFSWSINSTWSKKLKSRRRVWQAARDDS